MDLAGGPGRATPLYSSWQERSTLSAHVPEWDSPAVERVCIALDTGKDPAEFLRQLGNERARAGADLEATFADIDDMCSALGLVQAPVEMVRAVSVGWADGFQTTVALRTCVDSLTGLPTADYFTVRLGEIFAGHAGWPPYAERLSLVLAEPASAALPLHFTARMMAGVRWGGHFRSVNALALAVLPNATMIALVAGDAALDSIETIAAHAVNLSFTTELFRVRTIDLPDELSVVRSMVARLSR
jgi:hypothetical protein